MKRTIYLTTPIYYVNAEPHIGHLYTTVLADALKRYHLMMGDDVRFLTGTDEHGQKIAETAQKTGADVRDLTARVTETFRETWKAIGINNDDFIHTTEPRHKTYVQKVLQRVFDTGDIQFSKYTGMYCVGCERYLTQNEIVDGLCPDHKTAPRQMEESNYFFGMEKYRQRLLDHIQANPNWIRPRRYRNEILAMLKEPLEDLCISRPKTRLTWGIDLPFDESYVTYVWFDALLNYVSALKTTSDGQDLFDRYWTSVNHLIAKDILKTHAIYWPTMLMAAGMPLFQQIDVHGYWLSGDSKMSKSLGNVVRPLTFDRQFGIENLRYFFFREMSFGQDASFTYELFVERFNTDLANGLGNLLSRVSTLTRKNLGTVPAPTEPGNDEKLIVEAAAALADSYPPDFERREFRSAVEAVRGLLAATDRYLTVTEPWKLVKDPSQRDDLARVLYTGLEVVRIAAVLLSPIMPSTCRAILDYLGEDRQVDGTTPFTELVAWGGLKSGHQLGEVPRIFPRIDDKRLKSVLAETEEDGRKSKPAAEARGAQVRDDLEPFADQITIDEFAKIDLRVAQVLEASLVEGAKKLLRLVLDVGDGQPRNVFAGVRGTYGDPHVLVGRKVAFLSNLKPRQMRFGVSEGMVLAGHGGKPERLGLLFLDGDVLPGDRIT